jgi:hypothetical protein
MATGGSEPSGHKAPPTRSSHRTRPAVSTGPFGKLRVLSGVEWTQGPEQGRGSGRVPMCERWPTWSRDGPVAGIGRLRLRVLRGLRVSIQRLLSQSLISATGCFCGSGFMPRRIAMANCRGIKPLPQKPAIQRDQAVASPPEAFSAGSSPNHKSYLINHKCRHEANSGFEAFGCHNRP